MMFTFSKRVPARLRREAPSPTRGAFHLFSHRSLFHPRDERVEPEEHEERAARDGHRAL